MHRSLFEATYGLIPAWHGRDPSPLNTVHFITYLKYSKIYSIVNYSISVNWYKNFFFLSIYGCFSKEKATPEKVMRFPSSDLCFLRHVSRLRNGIVTFLCGFPRNAPQPIPSTALLSHSPLHTMYPCSCFRLPICYLKTQRLNTYAGRDSSVGITTRYGLDVSVVESRWGRYFPHPYRPVFGPSKPRTQWVLGFSRW